MIPLLIGFLARLIGLGGLSKKVKEFITKVQDKVDKAIDKAIAKIVNVVKKLFGKMTSKKKDGKPDPASSPEGVAALAALADVNKKYKDGAEEEELKSAIAGVRSKHKIFKSLSIKEGKDGFIFAYKFNPNGTVPGPKQKTVKIKLKRPGGFRLSTKKELKALYPDKHKKNVKAKAKVLVSEARRHIIPSDEIVAHYMSTLNGMEMEAAKALLTNKGKAPAKSTNKAVEAAAKELLRDFFNDVENLWVGNSVENSTIKNVRDFPAGWTPEQVDAHIQKIETKYKLK